MSMNSAASPARPMMGATGISARIASIRRASRLVELVS
jgi:hypothetical protein